jgi:glycosyltransferase involved in cell wall biosynthesis
VRFTGDLDAQELRQLYETATVTCLPSLNEAFGMVLLESLASGTPVVGADHGAIPEVINDAVGALFPPDDAEGCGRALLEVIERSNGPGMAAQCRARAEQYDWSVIGPQLVEVYEAVSA